MKSYSAVVGGKHVDTGKWTHVLDPDHLLESPASGLRLKRALDRGLDISASDKKRATARIGLASEREVEESIAFAVEGFQRWSKRPWQFRRDAGLEMHRRLYGRVAEYVDALVADGHPRGIAEWEAQSVLSGSGPEMYDLLSNEMHREFSYEGGLATVTRRPDGVVGLSLPRNAAGSNAAMAIPVLVAGNGVIIKAPRSRPYAAAWIVHEIILPTLADFNVDETVCQFICGDPNQVLTRWVEAGGVNDILFIGGTARGRKLERECLDTNTKPILELSGNDPIVVWKDADICGAARAAAECFMGSSQLCIVPKLAIVHETVLKSFLGKLEHEASAYKPGLINDKTTLLAPVEVSINMVDALQGVLDSGLELVFGGHRINGNCEPDPLGVYFEPTAVLVEDWDQALNHPVVTDETFFPLLPVVVVSGVSDEQILKKVEELLARLQHRLRLSIWADDSSVVSTLMGLRLGYGQIRVNSSHTGFVPGLPTHGGGGTSSDIFGEANYPLLRTTHLESAYVRSAEAALEER